MDDIRFYEDHARITIIDDGIRHTLFQNLRSVHIFEEIIIGINELCVKFDPLAFSEKEIIAIISAQITQPVLKTNKIRQHHFSIDFNTALDMALVCNHMNMKQTEFQHWFTHQYFKVDMMGFQPGFAYLSHDSQAPSISRLDKPRAMVSNGSVGFLGKTACIYAHDGPGGWPIIGSINTPIFNHDQNPPNLIQGGDNILFELL